MQNQKKTIHVEKIENITNNNHETTEFVNIDFVKTTNENRVKNIKCKKFTKQKHVMKNIDTLTILRYNVCSDNDSIVFDKFQKSEIRYYNGTKIVTKFTSCDNV